MFPIYFIHARVRAVINPRSYTLLAGTSGNVTALDNACGAWHSELRNYTRRPEVRTKHVTYLWKITLAQTVDHVAMLAETYFW